MIQHSYAACNKNSGCRGAADAADNPLRGETGARLVGNLRQTLACAVKRRGMARTIALDRQGALPSRPGRARTPSTRQPRAKSGHIAAAPPITPMSSRRPILEAWMAASRCSMEPRPARGHAGSTQDGRAADNLIGRKALFQERLLFFIIHLHRLHFTLCHTCCVRHLALRCRREMPYLLLFSRRWADVCICVCSFLWTSCNRGRP